MHISTDERRAGVVERHHLDRSAESALQAVLALVAVHSSDPVTPYLSMRARVPDFTTADLDEALFGDRTLWRLHAMRRTLFVVAAAEAHVFEAAASRQIAERERTRLIGWLSTELTEAEAEDLLAGLAADVLAHLEGGAERKTAELSEAIPGLQRDLTVGSGKWVGTTPLSSRLLYLLAMEGAVVRTRPAGSWRSSQYAWGETGGWFGDHPMPLSLEEGKARLIGRYLESFGPATMTDLRWWTGWTVREVRAALEASGAEPVVLDDGEGFVGPEYSAPATLLDRTVTLLPGLDSTAMGWKDRDWYVDPDLVPVLFDRNGNIGPTVWAAGKVVGGWAQAADGSVRHRLLENVEPGTEEQVVAECERLGEWLGEFRVTPRFRAPLEKELAG